MKPMATCSTTDLQARRRGAHRVLDPATVGIVAQIESGRAPDGLAWSVMTP
jgi:hypothetical protein